MLVDALGSAIFVGVGLSLECVMKLGPEVESLVALVLLPAAPLGFDAGNCEEVVVLELEVPCLFGKDCSVALGGVPLSIIASRIAVFNL